MPNDPPQNQEAEGDFDAVIVGAGFVGLYMLHRLRRLGPAARGCEGSALS